MITTTNNRKDYVGSGATAVFAYDFYIFADSDLLVTKVDTTTTPYTETTLVLNTDYTVSNAGVAGGGYVTLTAGVLASGYSLTIRRVLPITQLTDIRNQGSFYPETHEDAFDRHVMVAQQIQDALDRTLKARETDYTTPLYLPSATERASKTLVFDSLGAPAAGTLAALSYTVSSYMQSMLNTASAATAQTYLGISTFVKTLIDDTTAAAFMTTLGITSFVQTLLDDASASSFLTTLGLSAFSQRAILTGPLAPNLQDFTSSATYGLSYYFIITSGSATAAATYTNSGNTFTVVDTISSATLLLCTSNGAPAASGTLTKSGGTGDSTITYSAFKAPSYVEVELFGGGGGGAGGGNTGTNGVAGGNSTFGSTIVVANGGGAGIAANASNGPAGGTASLGTGAKGVAVQGASGGGSGLSGTGGVAFPGGMGGSSPLGGAGAGGVEGSVGGQAAIANSGSGGGGGGGATTASGTGGGAGGYAKAKIANPAATYVIVIGAKGTGGNLSGGGGAGGDGGKGRAIVWEYF